jgi:hypothetical protein
MGIENRDILEGIANDLANNLEAFGKLSNDWLNFLCDGLVLLLRDG